MSSVKQTLESLFPDMVAWRRHLHRHPELSFHESATAAFVEERLRQWGLEVEAGFGGGNGVVARLRGASVGPTIALRADMDALPIQDEKSCEYASTVPGVMHACGHDAHTATLLAVAKAFSEHRGEFGGTVVFLFQPAEEMTPGGALALIEAGALEGVEAVYGIHLWTPWVTGSAYSRPGAFMAAADEFGLVIKGKGGHGGLPHETIDSVFVASQLVVNLQGIVSRNADPTEPCVVSVGSLHAGTSFNIIAETAQLSGTVRTFDPTLRLDVKRRLETIVEQTCTMHGASYRLDYKLGYPPVINHPSETERFFRAAAAALGEQQAQTAPYIMAGEDFAYYLERKPGCFIFVGAGNGETGASYPHHHPKFDIDERAMLNAAYVFAELILGYAEPEIAGK